MRTRYKTNTEGDVYFITSTIVKWLPLFMHEDHFKIIISSLEYCRNNYDLRLYSYVIMENHFHLIAGAETLSLSVQAMKSFTAKKLLESISEKRMNWLLNQLAFLKASHKKESSYQVWQEGYHPQKIQDMEMLRQKMEYLHHNPVRRGYVARPEYWKYSSAGELLTGVEGVIKMDVMES